MNSIHQEIKEELLRTEDKILSIGDIDLWLQGHWSGTFFVIYIPKPIILSNMNTLGQKVEEEIEFQAVDRF